MIYFRLIIAQVFVLKKKKSVRFHFTEGPAEFLLHNKNLTILKYEVIKMLQTYKKCRNFKCLITVDHHINGYLLTNTAYKDQKMRMRNTKYQ